MRVVLDGACTALDRGDVLPGEIILVGPEAMVRQELKERVRADSDFQVADAPDLLDADDGPVQAMRKKPRNSIAVCTGLVKEGKADALISAGSTGIVVAAATLGLRCLEGIRRPGIACIIEGETGPFMVMDVGANPQPKADHLLQYGLMGSAYFKDTFGVEKPRVGLLNIGAEARKGNPVTREAQERLEAASLNFVGNVEGDGLFRSACDVVVCDGFAGNVMLKVSEGVAEYVLRSVVGLMKEAKVEPAVIQQIVGSLMRKIDFSEYGGALLLGVEGIVTICHGRSEGHAFANAIRLAHRAVGAGVNAHIVAAARESTAAVAAESQDAGA